MFRSGELLKRLRQEKPLIHHITNQVTMGDCADATLSIGALPVMAHAIREVGQMVASARAAVINIGTLYPSQVDSMMAMGKKALQLGLPVVLDPVGVGATSYRTEVAHELLRSVKPAVIKGNGGEIGTLAGIAEARVSGVQSIDTGGDPLQAAKKLLENVEHQAVVVVTGAVDLITDGRRVARVHNGHELLPQVVGSGCMAASLVAAFAGVEEDPFHAAVAAMAAMGVAGEQAAALLPVEEKMSWDKRISQTGRTRLGPARFKIQLLDSLYHLDPDELDSQAEIEVQ